MTPLLCQVIGHRRSRRDARWIGKRWISYCRLCGAKMVRDGPQCWTAIPYVDGVADVPEYAPGE